MIGPLLFRPIYQERVWGGRNLEQKLGRTLPADKVIGESWEVVDRPEAQSVVADGPLVGQSIRKVIEDHAAEVMGPNWDPSWPFPILVKWLDCQERLSLQVHPPAEIAPKLGGEPKTENWFVADAAENAGLVVGLRRGVTREAFEDGIKNTTLEGLVHRFPVSAGDSILVQSGRLHAIDAGNLILEIQQNSDTTYRVYDWGRVDLDGKPRQLHVEQSLACIDFHDFEPEPMRSSPGDAVLAECAEFRIRRFERGAGTDLAEINTPGEARMLAVVQGSVSVDAAGRKHIYGSGDNVVIPAAVSCQAAIGEDALVLVTDSFSAN